MRIGIDLRCLMDGRSSGVEEFSLQLVNHLVESDKKNEYILFFNSYGRIAFDFSRLKTGPNVRLVRTRWPNKLLNLMMWYFGWPKIDRLMGGADLVYFPNLNFGKVSKSCRSVQTVHDLSFEHYPEMYSLKSRLWHFFVGPGSIFKRSDRIVSVSHATADDLAERYRASRDKITTIHSAISQDYRRLDRNDLRLVQVAKKYGLPYRFILFLGTLEHRKNIVSLLQAFAQLVKSSDPQIRRMQLVLAGNRGYGSDRILDEIERLGIGESVRMTGPVDEADKLYIYNLSSLFVYPSLYEGFGFPVLEAMACGVPVITSNLASMPEISGDAAILIDPEKPDEILQAMRFLLSDNELREKFRLSGERNIQRFDWNKTARDYLKVFQDIFRQK